MAVVAASAPKRHGFSIESLIGRRDDSPRRHQAVAAAHAVLLHRPEDFSRDPVCSRDARTSAKDSQAKDLSTNNRSAAACSEASQDYRRPVHHSRRDSPPLTRDSLYHALPPRHSPPRGREALFRDSLHRDRESSGFRDFQTDRDLFRDRVRSPARAGTVSPSATSTDEDRRDRAGDRPSSASPVPLASSSPRLPSSSDSAAKAGTPCSASPESENRLGGWSSEDLKHLLHSAAAGPAGAFHPGGHPHHLVQHHGLGGVDSASGLFQPLRVCNRSLSAAMNSLMPHQFANLPFNPLLYFQRDLAAAAAATHPHHPAAAAAHPLLARYSGFMHPRYPLGPPHPGLLFHPYRKPKRNRTAFSPNQLLQLEQAFEKNHYVVGQERKSLASKLQLTETQVKVWFQNRRTKHKRMKAEEEQGGGGVTSGDEAGKTGDHSDGEPVDNKSDATSDNELIAGDGDDVCLTDDDEELSVTEDS